MEVDPSLTMKSDCYRTRNACATRENSASRGSYYPDCRKDAQCNCEMCMDSMQATMDLRSPNNMCSSITDWSESHARRYATPPPYGSAYSWAGSSLYEGKENRCPKTERSGNKPRKENIRVSAYATDDDGQVITERKGNILFGGATDDGSLPPERRKPGGLYGQVAEPRKEMGLAGIGAHDESITAEIERNTKTPFGDVADDVSAIAEMERKGALFGDAADDCWPMTAEAGGQMSTIRDVEADFLRKLRILVEADRKRDNSLLGNEAHDRSMTAEIEGKKSLFANDGSIRARIERRNRSFFGDVVDDGSMTARVDRRNQRLLGDAVIDGSMITRVESSNEGLLGDSAGEGSMTASVGSSSKSLFGDESDAGTIIAERRRRRKRREEGRTQCGKLRIILFLLLGEFILPWCFSSLFELSLTADKVKDISEESLIRRRLSDRLDFVARKLSRIVPGQVVNCTGSDSTWKLQQDGLLVYSHCTLYSSMVEEVSLWGFPSQTAGVMGREITDRSFIIMSGRMIEWYEGKTDYVLHEEGDSWTHKMLTASVVQMDGKTWILEYRPVAILQGGGLVSWALRFLKWRACGIFERVRLNFRSFLLPKLSIQHIPGDLRTPT